MRILTKIPHPRDKTQGGRHAKKRIPPSKRLSKQILELVQGLSVNGNKQELLSKLMQLSMRRTIQEILEQEVSEHIGKGYYEQGQSRNGHRNGYKPAHIRTAENKLLVERPQVDDPNESFRSNVWKHIKGNTERLERIVVEMYTRGCSIRDIEALLKDEYGNILLSKSAISQLNNRLWQEYESFCKADFCRKIYYHFYVLLFCPG